MFQTYYQQNTFKDQSASNTAWIGSIQYGLVFVPVCVFYPEISYYTYTSHCKALFTGRLLDLGYYNVPLAINSLIYVAALVGLTDHRRLLSHTTFPVPRG